MDIQIRTTELTDEQKELEKRIFVAAEILKTHGIECEAVKLFASKPTDSPACISFKL